MNPALTLESAVFVLLACAAAAAVAALVTARAARRRAVTTAVILVLAAASTLAFRFQKSVEAERARLEEIASARPLNEPSGDYVGSAKCRACHPSEYASWRRSYHRTMTQEPGPEAVLGDFDDVELQHDGGVYRLSQRGDEYWVTSLVATKDGLEVESEDRIVMTTGSHHTQAYWLSAGRGRMTRLFDFAFKVEERRWLPLASVFVAGPGTVQTAEGRWSEVCGSCHATRVEPRMSDPDNVEPRAAEFGIACEACHGPAHEHVTANQAPPRRYDIHLSGDADPTIVNPPDLPHGRVSQVCGQCHSVHHLGTMEARRAWEDGGFLYRPGNDLSATRVVTDCRPENEPLSAECVNTTWPDGMVRVTGREYQGLIMSPCHERGDMTCLSCHQLHQSSDDPRSLDEWANDQLGHGKDGDEACLQCHDAYRADPGAHTRHTADSSGSRCYNCHMPNTTWGLQQATRSHQVSSPSVAANLETSRPNACNLCHLDQTLRWTAEHLKADFGQPIPDGLSADQATIAASIHGLLTAEAGQRALWAWHLGWGPARAASGTEWMAPFLVQLLEDPYDVVRYRAVRSLRTIDPFNDFAYDSVAPAMQRELAAERARILWPGAPSRSSDALLLDDRGLLRQAELARLLAERDDRYVYLQE